MSVIDQIAQGVQPPQIADPIEQQTKLLNLRALIQRQPLVQQQLQQQVQAGAQENQERQWELNDQQIARQAYMDSGGDMNKFQQLVMDRGGSPKLVTGIQQQLLMTRQKMADLTKAQLEADATRHDAAAGAVDAFSQLPPDQQQAQWGSLVSGLRQRGLINDQEATGIPQQYPGADNVRLMRNGWKTSSQLNKEALDQSTIQKNKGDVLKNDLALAAQTAPDNDTDWQTWRAGLSPEVQAKIPAKYSGAARQAVQRMGVPAQNGPDYDIKARQAALMANMTPESVSGLVGASIDQAKYPEEYKRTLAQAQNAMSLGLGPNAVQGIIKDGSDRIGQLESRIAQAKATAPIKVYTAAQTAQARADAAGLTDDDYQRAGEQYARTGVMPAMGRDSVTRARIEHAKNEWARDNGFSPAQMVQMQAAYAGDKASLVSFQKQRDQIVSFEQTAQKNLDTFLGLASQIPDSGVPWVNTPLRLLNEKLVGSANMAAINAARQVANNEIAKVTSGGGLSGVLSDSARNEVASYNPRNATFAQTLAVARVLKNDMANRHESMDATLQDIKQRMGGGAGGSSGAVQTGPRKGDIQQHNGDTYEFDGQVWRKRAK